LENVRFIPRQPLAVIGVLLAQADTLLIHLRDDPLCRVGIPQKTQAYLAAGRPIIVAVKGDAAALVAEAQAGMACEPEDPASIAAIVQRLYGLPEEERKRMGQNGRTYYDRYLSFAVGSRRMEALLRGATR
jgi:glycosyltransferase involved in cell wall biosynthesis